MRNCNRTRWHYHAHHFSLPGSLPLPPTAPPPPSARAELALCGFLRPSSCVDLNIGEQQSCAKENHRKEAKARDNVAVLLGGGPVGHLLHTTVSCSVRILNPPSSSQVRPQPTATLLSPPSQNIFGAIGMPNFIFGQIRALIRCL